MAATGKADLKGNSGVRRQLDAAWKGRIPKHAQSSRHAIERCSHFSAANGAELRRPLMS